ncbi:MAG: DUF3786 domain-containing protein [Desulfobacterales bacterium]|nr:DUF3786 domain-containing protein [Desulfobacterales bacterium]
MTHPESINGQDASSPKASMTCFSPETAKRLGLLQTDSEFTLLFFNTVFALTLDGKLSYQIAQEPAAIREIITDYLSRHHDTLEPLQSSITYISFREFTGASPLFARFVANTSKTIESHFSGQLDSLEKKCLQLGGSCQPEDNWDLRFKFMALPKIPVILNYNDRDDFFARICVFSFSEHRDQLS